MVDEGWNRNLLALDAKNLGSLHLENEPLSVPQSVRKRIQGSITSALETSRSPRGSHRKETGMDKTEDKRHTPYGKQIRRRHIRDDALICDLFPCILRRTLSKVVWPRE